MGVTSCLVQFAGMAVGVAALADREENVISRAYERRREWLQRDLVEGWSDLMSAGTDFKLHNSRRGDVSPPGVRILWNCPSAGFERRFVQNLWNVRPLNRVAIDRGLQGIKTRPL